MKKKVIFVFVVASISFYTLMFLGIIDQRLRIDELESTTGNQRVELISKEKAIKDLQNEVEALNLKVDEIPK